MEYFPKQLNMSSPVHACAKDMVGWPDTLPGKRREGEESYRILRTRGSAANTSTRSGSPHDGFKRRFQRLAKDWSSEESLST